jgi:hypothetical protein
VEGESAREQKDGRAENSVRHHGVRERKLKMCLLFRITGKAEAASKVGDVSANEFSI